MKSEKHFSKIKANEIGDIFVAHSATMGKKPITVIKLLKIAA